MSQQTEYHQGLPQGGSNGTVDSINSISISESGSVPGLVLGLTDQQNPDDNGNYMANLDNVQGTFSSAFVRVESTPTPTNGTPTPGSVPAFDPARNPNTRWHMPVSSKILSP